MKRIFGLLLLPCMLYGMDKELLYTLQNTMVLEFSFETVEKMIWQEMRCIEPYIDSANGYVELLKKVNEQLVQHDKTIDLSENEFFQGIWDDKELQHYCQQGLEDHSKLEIFHHKWQNKVRTKLAQVTPIQHIKRHSNQEVSEVIQQRLKVNKDINPDDLQLQEKLQQAKQVIYYCFEIEKIVQKKQSVISSAPANVAISYYDEHMDL